MSNDGQVAGTLSPPRVAESSAGTLVIDEVSDMPRLHTMEQVQMQVWGRDQGTVVPAHVLVLIAQSGGIVLGAFDSTDMVGFAFGLLGRQGEKLFHASHMLGITPAAQGTGIGAALKLGQRDRALRQGLDLMTWTFDPLEARNAYFNLHKLGVISRTYRQDYYGLMDDALNRGLPSDRLYVEWQLRGGTDIRPREGTPDAVYLLRDVGGEPVLTLPEPPLPPGVLIEAPVDVQDLKRHHLPLALAWRVAQRAAFGWAFSQGYLARDFVNGAFVLAPARGIDR